MDNQPEDKMHALKMSVFFFALTLQSARSPQDVVRGTRLSGADIVTVRCVLSHRAPSSCLAKHVGNP